MNKGESMGGGKLRRHMKPSVNEQNFLVFLSLVPLSVEPLPHFFFE